jgi:hypothetical protein
MIMSRFRRWSMLLPVVLAVVCAFVLFDQLTDPDRKSTSLDWTRPVAAESGAPIANIAGYNVRCWGEGGTHTFTIRIDDPSVTHYELDELPPARYQCAVSAFTNDELESGMSNFVARTVN